MKKILIFIMALTWLFGASRQFYFIGKVDRLGSYTKEGVNEKGIFLRWDIVEGKIPNEIAYFKLVKQINDTNTTLAELNAHGFKSKNQIKQLLFKANNTQELYDLINALNKSDDSVCNGANVQNIADKIISCAQKNSLWAFLASRSFFHVAVARNRAYLDTNIPNNVNNITYYLLGLNSSKSKSILLGKLSLNPTQTSPIPKPINLKQIISSKCNDKRFGLDDMRVALHWEMGGSKSEQFINSLSIAGYDVFYSTKPANKLATNFAQNINIANIAKNLNASSNLNWEQFGIKKANKSLVTLSQQKKANEPIYLETQKELIQRGFLPGEERYYFIVPKDFSGKYGPTAFIKVKIPDLLPPQKPFMVRAAENNTSIDLIWQVPTLKNFTDYYKHDLKLCLAQSLIAANRYHFVDIEKSCDDPRNGFDTHFNIDKFLVYRFDDFNEAASFDDRDLDGVNDKDETNATLCKSTYPNGAKNYLVATIKNNGQEIVRFQDKSVKVSKVYWYRIASVTKSGISSYLTAPVRAYVPNRGIDEEPKFNVTIQKGYELILNNPNGNILTIDKTQQKIVNKVLLFFPTKVVKLIKNSNQFSVPNEIFNKTFDGNNYVIVKYFDSDDNLILKKSYKISTLFILEQGERGHITELARTILFQERYSLLKNNENVSNGCFWLNFDNSYYQKIKNEKICIGVELLINNKRYRIDEMCDVNKTQKVCVNGAKTGDTLSLKVYGYNTKKAIYSHPKFFSMRLGGGYGKINPPYIKTLILDKTNNEANVSYIRSFENIDAIEIELYKKGSKKSFHKIIAQGNKQKGKSYFVLFDNIQLKDGDSWCVRGKSIVREGGFSNWSKALCKEIVSVAGGEQENMPWPKLPNNVKEEDAKEIVYENQTGEIVIRMLKLEPFRADYDICDFTQAFNNLPEFVVYRQRIFDDGSKGAFVQVSPLISNVKAICQGRQIITNNLNISLRDKVLTKGYLEVVFIDKYPYSKGAKYKYIIVGFDSITKEVAFFAKTTPEVVQVQ